MPLPSPKALALASLLLPLCQAACAGGSSPDVIGPAPDPEGLAASLEEHTALDQPVFLTFRWYLNESGVRVKGTGVARIEPPYKARLDLFLDNGETIVKAALVDGELRMPEGMPDDILPPPDLMWGALGVFRPETGTELLGADRLQSGALRLRYRNPDGEGLAYTVSGGALRSLELSRSGHAVQTVELVPGEGSPYPQEATYRNLSIFRELKMSRDSMKVVAAYPPDIWDPTAASGAR